jgi:hypothetical protein
MTKHVKDLLPSILPKPESWKLALLQEWDTIIGDLKIQVRLDKIQKDTLILSVSNTSWMQELYCLSDVLIKKINAKLGHPYVKKLRFKYSSIRKKNPNKVDTKNQAPFHEISLTFSQKKALEKIEDLHLKQALKKYLMRCHSNNFNT